MLTINRSVNKICQVKMFLAIFLRYSCKEKFIDHIVKLFEVIKRLQSQAGTIPPPNPNNNRDKTAL